MLDHLIVIVPGIGGSVLADESGTPVWGDSLGSVARNVLWPHGLERDRSLTPVALFSTFAISPWHLITGYDQVVATLADRFGLTAADIATAHPHQQVNPDASLVRFPYDFRQSVTACAEALARELSWRLAHQPRRVIIYAHSMGGLVATWWWAMLGGREVTEAIITLGTPYRGATKALDWLVNGVRLGPLPLGGVTDVLRTWDATYHLVPTYKTVRDGDTDIYPHDLRLASPEFRRRTQEAYQQRAEVDTVMTELLDDPVLEQMWTQYHSAGHGTMSRAEVVGDRLVCTNQDPAWAPNDWAGGDGTVPFISAVPPWLEGRGHSNRRREPERHDRLPENPSALDQVMAYGQSDLPGQARVADPHRAFLLLDYDDIAPAHQPMQVGIRLEAVDPGEPTVQAWLGSEPVDVHPRAEGWTAHLPPLTPGIHALRVEATGLPTSEPVELTARIGAVDPNAS